MENKQTDEQKLESYKLKLLTATENNHTKDIKYFSVKVTHFIKVISNKKLKEVAHITGAIYDESFKQEWIDDMKQKKIDAMTCHNEGMLFQEEQELEKKIKNEIKGIVDEYEEYNKIQKIRHQKEHRLLNAQKIYHGGLACDYEAQIGPAFFDFSQIQYYTRKVMPDIRNY